LANGKSKNPDYGIDAPNVLRNLFLIVAACLLFRSFWTSPIHLAQVIFLPRPMLYGTETLLVPDGRKAVGKSALDVSAFAHRHCP
jgi:hypothetical protein